MSDAESQRRFITSVTVERSRGPHEYVGVWIRGAKVGTLCVGQGDGEPLRALLEGDHETLNRIAAAADKVLGISLRQDMRRTKRMLETPSNFAEERAKQVLAESLAEAGQDVKP